MGAKEIINLDKRLMAVEIFLGMTPDTTLLPHPKAFRQAVQVRQKEAAHDLLRDELHRYIYGHYDQGTQASLTAMVAGILAIMLNPESSDADRIQAQVQLAQLVAVILPAWTWVQQVLKHFYNIAAQITETGVYVDPDFSQFDASDPGVSLKALVKGE